MGTSTILTVPVLAVGGVVALVIPFLVNLSKKVISVKYSPIVAFVLGGVLGAGADLLGMTVDLNLMQSIVAGIVLGGTSTGLYDVRHQLKKK